MSRAKKLENLNSHFPNARIIDGTIQKLSGGDIKVYLVIAMHKDFNTGLSFPGYRTITKHTGITSRFRIKEHIDILVAHDLITAELTYPITAKGKTSKKAETQYRVL